MKRILSEIREKTGYETQESLAKAVNCSRSAVAKWETGRTYPQPLKLVKLAKLLKVSEGEIIASINPKSVEEQAGNQAS